MTMAAAEDESCNDVMSMSMSIHIPWDILNEHGHYKCPTAVNIELSPKNSPRRQRRHSSSTKTQGQLVKGIERRMTLSSKETTSSSVVGLSQKQLTSLRNSVMERPEDVQSGVPNNSFQDVIEMVAAANEHLTDFTNPAELPELRTSPCLFHSRKHNGHLSPHRKHGQQLLYASNFHAGCSPRSTASKMSGGSGDHHDETVEMRIQMERTKLFHQDIQNGQNQTYSKPSLPQSMASKDFIKSWLQNGSQPSGHFPEVVLTTKSTNQKCLLSPRPLNNRQMLAPIPQTVKNKKHKRNS